MKIMKINLFNQFGDIDFDFNKIITAFEEYFSGDEEVSLILVNEEEIRRLNRDYRNIDAPTDVISFPDEEENYRGDIFICIEKVNKQAEEYDHSREREFAFLLVHGLLHLQGYDHKHPEDEKIMIQKQEEILTVLGYRRTK